MFKAKVYWHFPCEPMVRSPHFKSRGYKFDPGLGAKIPHAVQYGPPLKNQYVIYQLTLSFPSKMHHLSSLRQKATVMEENVSRQEMGACLLQVLRIL